MTRAQTITDVAVIGGGITGASCLYHLARTGLGAVMLERESQLGTHSTSRSAATLVPGYGGAINDELTQASTGFLESGAEGLANHPLLSRRDLLTIHPVEPDGPPVDLTGEAAISIDDALHMCPVLKPEAIQSAMVQRGGQDIDVEELLQSFMRGARAHGAAVYTSNEALTLNRKRDHWEIKTPSFTVLARKVVNAAGAWVDHVAVAAGLAPLGVQPMKRTAFVAPVQAETVGLPLVLAGDNSFYFKPDIPGVLMCSRSDEIPHDPGDPTADELDVAYTIERINALTTLNLRSVHRTWAGLRTFTAERQPVLGPHQQDPTFVWCAALGGTGIQTSPAVGQRIAAFAQ